MYDENRVSFEELNERYIEITLESGDGDYKDLEMLVQDNKAVQNYITAEVENHHYNYRYEPDNIRSKIDADKYLEKLLNDLEAELTRRGEYQDAQALSPLYRLTNSALIKDISENAEPHKSKRMSIKQYYIKIQKKRSAEMVKLGITKTNADKLALAIQILCDRYYPKH